VCAVPPEGVGGGVLRGQVAPHATRLLKGRPADAAAVAALMLSCFWPYFTYWVRGARDDDAVHRPRGAEGDGTAPAPGGNTRLLLTGRARAAQGPTYIRRNAFLMTYQPEPSFALAVDTAGAATAADGAMAGGRGPSWAVARMWFWGLAMLLLAWGYCDREVHPAVHRHVTQVSESRTAKDSREDQVERGPEPNINPHQERGRAVG
jgi:hypothetical protein